MKHASTLRPRHLAQQRIWRALALPLFFFFLFLPRAAHAKPTEEPEVVLTLTPLFGDEVTSARGWTDFVVQLSTPREGSIHGEFRATSEGSTSVVMPANLTASTTVVIVPVRVNGGVVDASFTNDRGRVLAKERYFTRNRVAPTLLVWAPGSLVGQSLFGSDNLRIGMVQFDSRSGAPIVPTNPAGYAPIDAVLLHPKALAALDGAQLAALTGWVAEGGTLAVVTDDSDALDAPPLVTMLGSGVRRVPAAVTAQGAPGGSTTPPLFHGGHLRDTPLGSAASHGLGEVILLAFDPLSNAGVRDPSAQAQLRQLATHSFQHRSALSESAFINDEPQSAVLRALDPNQSHRGALALAGLVLVLYAALAGPVLHLRARRRKRPLDPLVQVPLVSAGAFGLIVLLGLASKGFGGRARHLALLESGAGQPRATGVAYRGFFASRTTKLTLTGSSGRRLSRVDRYDEAADDRYAVTPEGLTLALTVCPWRTVVVREAGFTRELGGGIALRRRPDGTLTVRNGTPHGLRDVVLADGSQVAFFPRIESNVTVAFSEGRALGEAFSADSHASSQRMKLLSPYLVAAALGGEDGERVRATWSLAQEIAPQSMSWPDAAPVLLAELDAPLSDSHDSGLRLESERVLLRVVGEGGAL